MSGIEAPAPYAILATSSGAAWRVPTYDLGGNAAPVTLTPQEPFDQVAIVGDTEKVADKRASQIIPADQSGGAGRDEYVETEGVSDFRESDNDTRFAGAVVIRPERVSLGQLPTYGPGQMVIGAGYSGAQIHTWARGQVGYSNPGSGGVWTAFTGISGSSPAAGSLYGYAAGVGATYVATNAGIFRSTNGTSFTALGPAALLAGAIVRGLAIHDNKLWTVVGDTATGKLSLWACADPTNPTPASATWTRVADTPWTGVQESPVDLISWKDGANSPMLFILTSRRLLAYNALAVQIVEYDDWLVNNPEGGPLGGADATGICAAVFKSTGDLYVGQGTHCDYLMRYSPGAGFAKVGPNMVGGLTRRRQGAVRAVAPSAYGLGVWTTPTSVVGDLTASTTDGSGGQGWFLNDKGGWHTMNRWLDAASTRHVHGGGIGNRKYWTVFDNGFVEEQALPSVGSRPQFAVGRRYDTVYSGWHNHAKTDFGTTLLPKTLLGFTVHCLLSDGTNAFGLDAGCGIQTMYKIDGGPWQDVIWYQGTDGQHHGNSPGIMRPTGTAIGWPLRLLVNPPWGVTFRELEWRYLLQTNDPTKTPVVVFVGPRARKKAFPRYTYEMVADLGAAQPVASRGRGGPLNAPGGQTALKLHEVLTAIDRSPEMVSLTYGGLGEEVTIESCEFAMSPVIMPHLGVGRYRIVLRDLTSDVSG